MVTGARIPDAADLVALIDRSKHGDSEAFQKIVYLFQSRIRAFIGSYLRDADAVDDLAQEVFLAAFRSLPNYRGESAFSTWLFGISRNYVLMHLREQTKWQKPASLQANMMLWRAEQLEEDDLSNLAEHEREIAALQECIGKLPPDRAEMVSAHYFKARSIVEMARETGRKEGTLRMMLLRVRQDLRDCVKRRLGAAAN